MVCGAACDFLSVAQVKVKVKVSGCQGMPGWVLLYLTLTVDLVGGKG